MTGVLQTNDDLPETDVHGNNTGVVFVEFDPDYRLLGDYIRFCLAENRGNTEVLLSEVDHLEGAEKTPHTLIENYISFAAKMASTKHKAAVIAGVARHAGHEDNFLYNSTTDTTFLTDVDTAVATESFSDTMRGIQLLRDMARDMVRMMSGLSYDSYSSLFLASLEDGTHKPFEAFLRAYLGDSITESLLVEEAAALQKQYLDYVELKKDRLDWIATEMRKALKNGFFPVPERQMFSNWSSAHTMFMVDCLQACYRLIRKSNLGNRGFSLPNLSESELSTQLYEGLLQYCTAVQAESERVTGQSLPHLH